MKWISVKDRLPDDYQVIIVYGRTKCESCHPNWAVFLAKYNLDLNAFEYGEFDDLCEVTHWMPLPEPPSK